MPRLDFRRPLFIFSAGVVALIAVWFLLSEGDTIANSMGSTSPVARGGKYKVETVKGFFLQDEPGTDPVTFNYEAANFGLIERKYETDGAGEADSATQWERFEKYVHHLNEASPAGVTYRVIYNGRHGEGYHNLGETKYGTEEWDAYWSKLDGDGELFWLDAHLTERGQQQAIHNNAFLTQQFSEAKMPPAERYYVSPLYRCLQTANLSYSGINLPADRPFHPLIKELMREVMGQHTCDKRSSKSVIHKTVPTWDIEPGFTEQDELWQADHRETMEEQDARTQRLLDDIFGNDDHTFLSFTSHSGAIASLLRVLGHREFPLPTGALIPLFVKVTKLD